MPYMSSAPDDAAIKVLLLNVQARANLSVTHSHIGGDDDELIFNVDVSPDESSDDTFKSVYRLIKP